MLPPPILPAIRCSNHLKELSNARPRLATLPVPHTPSRSNPPFANQTFFRARRRVGRVRRGCSVPVALQVAPCHGQEPWEAEKGTVATPAGLSPEGRLPAATDNDLPDGTDTNGPHPHEQPNYIRKVRNTFYFGSNRIHKSSTNADGPAKKCPLARGQSSSLLSCWSPPACARASGCGGSARPLWILTGEMAATLRKISPIPEL